jgi:hypothetical protein
MTSGGAYNNRYSVDGANKPLLGGAVSFAYDSVVGPVELILSTSNINNTLVPYFSLGYNF